MKLIIVHIRDGDVQKAGDKDHTVNLVLYLRGEFLEWEKWSLPLAESVRRTQGRKYEVLEEEGIKTPDLG